MAGGHISSLNRATNPDISLKNIPINNQDQRIQYNCHVLAVLLWHLYIF